MKKLGWILLVVALPVGANAQELKEVKHLDTYNWFVRDGYTYSEVLALAFGIEDMKPPVAKLPPERETKPMSGESESEPAIAIVEIDTRVTERNNTWWKFAWKLTLRNNTSQATSVDAKIEWLDVDGFVVDDDNARGLGVSPGEANTFTGYGLVTADVAGSIATVQAKIRY